MKKYLSAILALCMVFQLSTPSLAVSDEVTLTNKSGLIESLNCIEPQKDAFGLKNVDFSNIYVGDMIHAYEYTSDGLHEIFGLYPLFENSTLIAFAIANEDGKYTITTALVNEVSAIEPLNVALIYDRHCCYLYNGSDITLLIKNVEEADNRVVLSEGLEALCVTKIALADMSLREYLGYANYPNAHNQSSYYCSVKYVTQLPYNHICWAATIACIVNCRTGTSYTAPEIAQSYYGSDFDYTLSMSNILLLMNAQYALGYHIIGRAPTDKVLVDNLSTGWPLFGYVKGSNGSSHACTLYGINTSTGSLSVMDPLFGAALAYRSSSTDLYAYVSPRSGLTFSLSNAIARK